MVTVLEMGSMYLLAVVCPVTQSAGRLEYLNRWISHAVEKNIQIIVVHDYRDEATSEELQQIVAEQDFGNIFFIEGTFGSAGAARNAGLEFVRSEWVCFWDSDDEPSIVNFLEVITNHSDSDVVIGQFQIRNERAPSRLIQGSSSKNLLEVANNPGIWRFAFRREAIQGIFFPTFPLGEDQAFLAQIDWTSLRVAFSQKNLYTYSQGIPTQLTRNVSLIPKLVESISFLEELLPRNGVYVELVVSMMFRQCLTLLKSSPTGIAWRLIPHIAVCIRALKKRPNLWRVFFIAIFR